MSKETATLWAEKTMKESQLQQEQRARIYSQLLHKSLPSVGRPLDSGDPRFHQLARLMELGLATP